MDRRRFLSRILCVAGIIVIVLGAAASRSGGELHRESLQVPCTLTGAGLVALGAFLGQSRHQTFVYGTLGLAVFGVSGWMAYWVLSLLASDVYSPPWILGGSLVVVRDLGTYASLIGAVCVLFESLFASKRAALGDVPVSARAAPGDVPVSTRRRWTRTLSLVGLAIMAIPAVALVAMRTFRRFDWLTNDSSLTLLTFPAVGSGLVALGAFLGKSRYRKFLYVALGLTLCGLIAALGLLNVQYYVAPWFEFVVLAYPIGAIMSLVGAVRVLIESYRRPPVLHDAAETA